MKIKELLKENIGVIALFVMLTTATSILMTACNAKVTPASPGIATTTSTPTNIPGTPTYTPTLSNVTINQGDIAFVGMLTSSQNQFAFVTTNSIPSGAQIYFTNYPYDSTQSQFVTTGADGNRGTILWSPTSSVAAFTEIVVNAGIVQAGVTTAYANVVGGSQRSDFTGEFTFASGEDQVYCYQGTLANPTLFVSAEAVYTGPAGTGNVEPYSWSTSAVSSATAPATGIGPWAGLPSALSSGAGTTVVFNAYDNAASKTYRNWVYLCADTTGTKNGLIASINSVGNGTSTGVTTYVGGTGTQGYQTAVSILTGNSMGTTLAGASYSFGAVYTPTPPANSTPTPINTVVVGVPNLCNQTGGATPTGYSW